MMDGRDTLRMSRWTRNVGSARNSGKVEFDGVSPGRKRGN